MRDKKNKSKSPKLVYKKYNKGSFIKTNGSGIGAGAGILGEIVGGDAGNVLSGVGSGIAAGATFGPIGAGIGGAIGLVGSLLGNAKEKKARRQAKIDANTNYNDEFNSNLDDINTNPYGVFRTGGPVDGPDKPIKKVVKPRPYQPDITLPNWDGLVDKGDGTIGMWGNDITNVLPTVNPVPAPPLAKTDHLLRQSGSYYQGTTTTRDKIFEKEKALKAASNMKGYALGSEVEANIINIEKGELQIDPQSGKILREYNRINPETGGLYESHSKKGADTHNNLVTAKPGSFIITKAKANDYKEAVQNNDKIKQQTILQNIKNYKDRYNAKFKMGSYVPKFDLGAGIGLTEEDYKRMNIAEAGLGAGFQNPVPTFPKSSVNASGILDAVTKFGPAALNIGQGLFGKVEREKYTAPILNPYKSQILNNMPEEVNFSSIKNELYRNRNASFRQVDNNTSSSAVSRAVKNNMNANLSYAEGKLSMENKLNNNQVKGQRGSIYGQLAAQEMSEKARQIGYNAGVDQLNAQNRAAKQNMLREGLAQVQQIVMNDKTIKSKRQMEELQLRLMKEMFPNLKNADYSALFERLND